MKEFISKINEYNKLVKKRDKLISESAFIKAQMQTLERIADNHKWLSENIHIPKQFR